MLAYLPTGRIIVVVLVSADTIDVDQDVVMIVRLVDVGCNHDLHVVSERLSDESAAHAVNKFRRKVRVGFERLYIVYRLDATLPDSWQGLVKFVVSVVLVNILHVQICVLGVCEAVQGIAQKQTLGLVGVKYVPQCGSYIIVDRN